MDGKGKARCQRGRAGARPRLPLSFHPPTLSPPLYLHLFTCGLLRPTGRAPGTASEANSLPVDRGRARGVRAGGRGRTAILVAGGFSSFSLLSTHQTRTGRAGPPTRRVGPCRTSWRRVCACVRGSEVCGAGCENAGGGRCLCVLECDAPPPPSLPPLLSTHTPAQTIDKSSSRAPWLYNTHTNSLSLTCAPAGRRSRSA